MRKILLFICFLVSTMMMAGPVDQEAAKQKAQAFIANKMGAKAHRSMKATSSGVTKATNRAATRDYLYVFNIDGGGYVIVSADDRTEEILGYSTTGTFDANKMPENMRAFLQEYVDGIQYLDDHNLQRTSATVPQKQKKGGPRRAPRASIDPLIKARWNQDEPFDLYCPTYNGKQAATGCVATAFAQVMNHHKWPSNTTTEIPAYTSDTRGFNLDAIPAGTAIDWNNIKDRYGWACDHGNWNEYSYTDTEGQAVANLMKLCGRAVQMDYYLDNSGQSGAVTANCIAALVKYFDYEEETCKWLDRVNYSYSDWQDIIYAELAANRPVLYSGQSAGGGHAFVCDGYGSDDFFHINWGWGGSSDGFFRLRLLNPADQGIGGSSTSDGYGMGQGAGIGIQKNDGVVVPKPINLSLYGIDYNITTFTRTSSTENFTPDGAFVYNLINKDNGGSNSFDLGIRIVDGSGTTKLEQNIGSVDDLPDYYYISPTYLPDFGAGWADGTYKFYALGSAKGAGELSIVRDMEENPVLFTISGNTMTIASPQLEVSHEIVGDLSANSTQTIKIYVKNTGMKAFRSDLYYQVNSDKWYRGGFIDAEPNTTCTVEFKYTPTSTGTYSFYINPLDYTINMNIGGGSGVANLTGTFNGATPAIQYDNSTYNYYVNGTSTTASFTVKNTGDGDYNDNIVFNYFYYSSSESEWKYYKEDVRSVTLAPGASQNFNVTIDKVDNSDYSLYYVQMEWIVNNKETFLVGTKYFEFRPLEGGNYKLQATDLVGTPSLQYNTDAYIYYINGTESTFSIDITNTGSDDFSGQLKIEQAIHYAGGGNNWYYKDYPTYPEFRDVTILAGSTQRFSTTITKSTDETVDMYFVRMGYKGGNESDFVTLKQSPNFVFVDANTPNLVFKSLECDPPMIWDSEKSIYYVDGQKTKASFSITNVGGGAFDGKVKFLYYGVDSSDNWTQIKSATTQSFYVAGGATAVATSGTIEKTDGYDKYTICCYYVDPATGTEVFIRRTSYFEFRTGNTIPGDANGDGTVNVSDIVLTVNYIMGNSAPNFNKEAADLNGDGLVNVTDIVKMVNIIMEAAARQETDVNQNDEIDNSNAEVGLSDILKEGQVKY